jgi:osmotically-inducible protein OsmY
MFALLGALLFAGAVSGCATIEKCGSEECAGDQRIAGHVEAMLEQHPDLGPNLLTVETVNRVVYLNGQLTTDLQSGTAESVAQNVRGVKKVVNNISVNNN